MTDEQRIHELSMALLLLARWYEGDCGPSDYHDQVADYLATFPEGQRVLQLDEDNMLYPELFPKEK